MNRDTGKYAVVQGFSEDLVEEVIIDLQRQIHIKDEQLHLVNSCSVILVDNSKYVEICAFFLCLCPSLSHIMK